MGGRDVALLASRAVLGGYLDGLTGLRLCSEG